MMRRERWIITGGVQGVGFRPFLYRCAAEAAVTGTVANTSQGVCLEIQGSAAQIARFTALFEANLPPLAQVETCTRTAISPVSEESAFRILQSQGGSGHSVRISPDVALCADCLREIHDPQDRRFGYPFTNCTNCGPRYTITRSIPYDRATTSMACFPLCPQCQAEYTNPLNRRFHAQPNACPVCGPRLWLQTAGGDLLGQGADALQLAARKLAQGAIVAIKGLGGFHLAVDARNAAAVKRLRERKRRKAKPLAVMVEDLEAAQGIAWVSPAAQTLLTGPERPIVVLKARPEGGLAPGLSPDTEEIGVMAAYTPLHVLLLAQVSALQGRPAVLVMTSGNFSSEPIALGNREALQRLAPIADAFLLHDRDILIRCDDSVVRPMRTESGTEEIHFLRRARGYTPAPIPLADDGPCTLGVGGLLKNTLTVTKGQGAYVSQHIGDLENLETLKFFEEMAAHLPRILQVTPTAVVHDLHPDFLSTRYAQGCGITPCLALQHHVAHIHAVLAENHAHGPVLGLALDGTGLGDDGTIWGGEILLVETHPPRHTRLGHLAPVALPGGDAASREPWRMALAFVHALGLAAEDLPWPWLTHHTAGHRMVLQMLSRRVRCPQTTSCGRLFDAVAGLLGLCFVQEYEGQAAIRLEHIQDMTEATPYAMPCPTSPPWVLDSLALFAQVYEDWRQGVPASTVARRFHLGLVEGFATALARATADTGCTTVALSGGVFHNATMARHLPPALARRGLRVLTHRMLPPGDACISLGQAVYGRLWLAHN
jgi:hydrogenase maturation protein HypF